MKRESGQTFVSLLQKNMDQEWSVSSLPECQKSGDDL